MKDDSRKYLDPRTLTKVRSLELKARLIVESDRSELAGLKCLQRLYLQGTKATDAGVAELQKELPNCRINR